MSFLIQSLVLVLAHTHLAWGRDLAVNVSAQMTAYQTAMDQWNFNNLAEHVPIVLAAQRSFLVNVTLANNDVRNNFSITLKDLEQTRDGSYKTMATYLPNLTTAIVGAQDAFKQLVKAQVTRDNLGDLSVAFSDLNEALAKKANDKQLDTYISTIDSLIAGAIAEWDANRG